VRRTRALAAAAVSASTVAALLALPAAQATVSNDVVVNEVPDLFRPGGLYATASLAGAIAFVVGIATGVLAYANAAILGIALTLGLRLLSIRLGVAMPPPHWAARPKHPQP